MRKRLLITSACMAISLASVAQSGNVTMNGHEAAPKSDSLRMDSIIHSLPEVMVKGNKPIVKVNGAALVYDLLQLVKEHPADNAYEAIKLLPGVSEENETLKLNAQAVTLIIDGKATTMNSEQVYTLLKSIPTSRIASAEVLYSAPARYQVKGQVINIQLKHNTGVTGLQGELFGGIVNQNRTKYTERASLLYTNKKWEVDFLYSLSHGLSSKYYNNEFAHELVDGTSYKFVTRNDMVGRNNVHNIRLGANYDFAPKHNLSFAYTSEIENRHTSSEDTGDYAALLKVYSKSQLHDLRLDYYAPFGFQAGAEYTYYNSPDEQWLKSGLFKDVYDIASKQRIDKWNVYLKQEHALGKNWRLNYGANFTTSRDESSQVGNGSNKSSAQTEDQVGFYVGASTSFGRKLTMEASLMHVYYHTSVWNEWNLFPTLSMTYMPTSGHILKFNLGSNRSYPTYWSVKDFTTYSFGGYAKIVGNPNLKPASNYGLSLTYIMHSRYVATLFMNYQKDAFMQMPYQSATEKSMEYKFLNLDYSSQAGLILSAPVNVCKWWKNRLTLIGVYEGDKNLRFYDIPFNRGKWFCQATWNGTFVFGKHLLLNLDAFVHSPEINGVFDIPTSGYLNVAMTWKPLKGDRLTVKAYCNDIFKTNGNYLHDTFKGQHVINELHKGRTFGLSLTYRFGGYKTKKHDDVDTSRFGK